MTKTFVENDRLRIPISFAILWAFVVYFLLEEIRSVYTNTIITEVLAPKDKDLFYQEAWGSRRYEEGWGKEDSKYFFFKKS